MALGAIALLLAPPMAHAVADPPRTGWAVEIRAGGSWVEKVLSRPSDDADPSEVRPSDADPSDSQPSDSQPSNVPPTADGAAGNHHKPPLDKRAQLDGLFAVLKVAPDVSSSREISDRISQIYSESGSASADLLMTRASVAAEAKQYDLALEILDQVIAFEPDYLAALGKRATIRYMKDDYGGALADIREVLAREPRHFVMLYALALILRDIDQDKLALQAVRRAIAINPHLDDSNGMEKQLTLKVEGHEI